MAMERHEVSNFGAGPAAMPTSVLEKAQQELLNFRGTGMSVMEISHRHAAYSEVQAEAESLVRELLRVPSNYRVLFLQGGASLQFATVPMNLLNKHQTAAYVLTGSWSDKAMDEAKRYGEVRVAGSSKPDGYRYIPALSNLDINPNDAYVHLTSNNTIYGSQWNEFPDTGDVPLIADMSSDIMSRPFDIERFGLIYGGAQKNLGPAGVTLVIVRDDLVDRANRDIPTMLRYDVHVKNDSRYNTPPTFGVYLLGLVLQWIKQEGGVDGLAQRNEEKADVVYQAIDKSSGFYQGYVRPDSRSRMNVTFRLQNESLEKAFLDGAKQAGMVGLGGHRSVGGCRASLYNAVSISDCERLVSFMNQFQANHA